jgi:hypothetical protein
MRGERGAVNAVRDDVLGCATSLDDRRIRVEDLDGMGVAASAALRHRVGYAAVGFT